MASYSPPSGSPPRTTTTAQYAAPPGHPPTLAFQGSVEYAPPPGPPPQTADPLDEPENPAEPPPPYSKKPPTTVASVNTSADAVRFVTVPISPSSLLQPPLDPPPSCFSTPSPIRIRSRDFQPFNIPSNSSSLADGFQALYPPDVFTRHGVSPEDWSQFLSGVLQAARMAQNGVSAVAPYRADNRNPVRVFRGNAGRAYDAAFNKTPAEEVMALLQIWNGSALERRKIRVSLVDRPDESRTFRAGWDLYVEAL